MRCRADPCKRSVDVVDKEVVAAWNKADVDGAVAGRRLAESGREIHRQTCRDVPDDDSPVCGCGLLAEIAAGAEDHREVAAILTNCHAVVEPVVAGFHVVAARHRQVDRLLAC